MFLLLSKSFCNYCLATAARRQIETVVEFQASHARNSQGLCMLDVFGRVLIISESILINCLATTARRDIETEYETQDRRARDS